MKDIKEILQELDLDLSNPEVVQAASEAIAQILLGRMGPGEDPESLKDRLNKKAQRPDDSDEDDREPIDLGTIEQELDPNLIMPPQKPSRSGEDVETEIEDDEDVLSKIKQLGDDPNNQENNGNSNGNGNGNKPPENPLDNKKDDPDNGPGGDTSNEPGNDSEENPGTEPGNSPGGDPGNEPGGDPGDEPGGELDNKLGDDPEGLGDDSDGSGDDNGDDVDSDFTSKVSGKNPKNESQRIQISRTLKAAKNAQDKAEEAGQTAIASLLERSQELLEDMLDELKNNPSSEISEQKLGQVIKKTLDAISEVDKGAGLTFKSDEERDTQVQKIKDAMSDTVTTAELSAEDAEQIRAEKQAVINNKREIDKYAMKGRGSFRGFEDFIVSLRKALSLQIETEKTKANSWAAINRRYDGTAVVKPGIKKKTLPSTKVPVIDFYFDCSASWGDHDLEKGNEALNKIAQLEKDGEIKVNVFYFADGVYADSKSPRNDCGTGAWNYIIDNIILTKATNVVIMTDRDMERQCDNPPHKGYTVRGFVWYLWKDGVNAPRLPNLLKGRGGTLQYAFDSY